MEFATPIRRPRRLKSALTLAEIAAQVKAMYQARHVAIVSGAVYIEGRKVERLEIRNVGRFVEMWSV